MAPRKPTTPAKSESKALTKPRSTSIAEMSDDLVGLYSRNQGSGFELATASDYALPFIYLIQSNSPQVDEDSPKYVEGAKPGMWLNTVSQDLYDELTVIPCYFQPCVNEWIPRDEGGGFIATYPDKQTAEASMRAEGTQLVDTANWFILYQNHDGDWEQGILSLTSTKLAVSRKWLSLAAGRMLTTPHGKEKAPLFAGMYRLTSASKENDKGKFKVPMITPVEENGGWVIDVELADRAESFMVQVQRGQKGADFSRADEDVVEAEVEEVTPQSTRGGRSPKF